MINTNKIRRRLIELALHGELDVGVCINKDKYFYDVNISNEDKLIYFKNKKNVSVFGIGDSAFVFT